MPDRSATPCLDGVRVVEFARYQAGPRCGMLLSDLGAEVIKVEPPGGESTRTFPPIVNGQSVYFTVYNRGKKSIALDLRSAPGRQVARDLVKTADIVLENFRPGTMAKMGLDYDQLKALKPDIILVSVSGFGQYGPHRDRPAFDTLGQALSGLMTLTGQPVGQPVGTASSVVDRMTALHATVGALAALRERDRSGDGQVVDVALMDMALTMVEIPTSYYLSTGEEGGERGRPPYRALDGWVVITAATADQAARVLEAVESPDEHAAAAGPLAAPPGERPPFQQQLADWCAARTVAEICATLERLDVPVAPVRTIEQVAEDPHLWERGMLVDIEDPVAGRVYAPGESIKFSRSPGTIGPNPEPGEHTEELLRDLLGYSADRVSELLAGGGVGPRRAAEVAGARSPGKDAA